MMCALQHPVPDGRPRGRGVRCAPRDDLRQPGAQIHSLASGFPQLHTQGLRRKDIELCLNRGCSLLQCNGRGECNRGFCACHAGWYGHDCAQRRPDAPDSPGGPPADQLKLLLQPASCVGGMNAGAVRLPGRRLGTFCT